METRGYINAVHIYWVATCVERYTPIMVICEIVSSLAIVISAPFAFSQTGYPGMKEILLYTAFLP